MPEVDKPDQQGLRIADPFRFMVFILTLILAFVLFSSVLLAVLVF